jgi:hypothetical protein
MRGLPDGGRTLTDVVIAQGAAGSTDLAAAPGADEIIVVTLIIVTLDAAGTLKFTAGTGPTDLTGAMNFRGERRHGRRRRRRESDPARPARARSSRSSPSVGKAAGKIRYYVAPPI